MSAPQAPLLEVRDFGLEFRTRSGTVRALEGVDLRCARARSSAWWAKAARASRC
jgi:hypothetical protein